MFTDKKGRKGEGDIIFLLPMNIKNATVVGYSKIEHQYVIVISNFSNFNHGKDLPTLYVSLFVIRISYIGLKIKCILSLPILNI